MSACTDEATFHRFVEQAVNNGRLDVIDEIFQPACVGCYANWWSPAVGPAECRRWVQELRTAFPDLEAMIDDSWMIRDGNARRVAVLLAFCGTHRGSFIGIPATGKRVRWTQVHLLTFDRGRVAEDVVISDTRPLRAALVM